MKCIKMAVLKILLDGRVLQIKISILIRQLICGISYVAGNNVMRDIV